MRADDLAAQVEGHRADVVDVDLGADAADATAVELDVQSRAADVAALQDSSPDQPPLAELGDQAGDGGAVEAGGRGDPGPRPRLVVTDGAQYEPGVVPAQRRLVDRFGHARLPPSYRNAGCLPEIRRLSAGHGTTRRAL